MDEDRLARIEAMVARLVAAWEAWEPILARLNQGPMGWAIRRHSGNPR